MAAIGVMSAFCSMKDAATCSPAPVVLFLALLHALHYFLVRRFRSTDAWLLISSIAAAMISVIAALSGISTAACLVLLAFAPAVTILAYELRGYQAATLAN